MSVPPQHGKTETVLHGLAWMMQDAVPRHHAYVTYEATRAERMSMNCMSIAERAALRPDGNRGYWRTESGSSLVATGIGGPLTGEPISGVLVVDDPHKNREEANSALQREKVHDWFRSTASTRVHPGGSTIIVHTRWHEDDLIGRLAKEKSDDGSKPWEYINLPALNDDGVALWPEQRPVDWLTRKRVTIGEFEWAALYMGRPMPRGGSLFLSPTFYESAPSSGFRVGIGVDLAYSAETSADYSVAVVCAKVRDTVYVLDVVRKQVHAPDFERCLAELRGKYPGARWRAYIAGGEKGVASFMGKLGTNIGARPAKGDKFTRAQPVAAGWNAGNVQIPRAKWTDAFVSELESFTGIGDKHDDQVDALAAAFDALATAGGAGGQFISRPSLDDRPVGF